MARFLVCEKTGGWATALRRRLAGRRIQVFETRSLQECREELSLRPNSILGLELRSATLPSLVQLLGELGRDFPRARAIVFAPYRHAACQWLVREAGAVHVAHGRRGLEGVERLVERHLETQPDNSDETLQEVVWRRLPWPEANDAGSA